MARADMWGSTGLLTDTPALMAEEMSKVSPFDFRGVNICLPASGLPVFTGKGQATHR